MFIGSATVTEGDAVGLRLKKEWKDKRKKVMTTLIKFDDYESLVSIRNLEHGY
jgi:hypothetical protein